MKLSTSNIMRRHKQKHSRQHVNCSLRSLIAAEPWRLDADFPRGSEVLLTPCGWMLTTVNQYSRFLLGLARHPVFSGFNPLLTQSPLSTANHLSKGDEYKGYVLSLCKTLANCNCRTHCGSISQNVCYTKSKCTSLKCASKTRPCRFTQLSLTRTYTAEYFGKLGTVHPPRAHYPLSAHLTWHFLAKKWLDLL